MERSENLMSDTTNDSVTILGGVSGGNACIISGTICDGGANTISGVISTVETLEADISIGSSFNVEEYDGTYSIIPTVDEQVLYTKQKMMTDNLTIQKIPYYEVSNTAGGTTVSIAELEV